MFAQAGHGPDAGFIVQIQADEIVAVLSLLVPNEWERIVVGSKGCARKNQSERG